MSQQKLPVVKILFDNTASNAPLSIMGATRIHIPAFVKTEASLPDNDKTKSLLSRLTREYPALKISITPTGDSDPKIPLKDSADKKTPSAKGSNVQHDKDSNKEQGESL